MAARRNIEVVEGVDSFSCSKCNETKSIGSFNKREPYVDGSLRYRSKCIECERGINLTHYHVNRKGEQHRRASYTYTLRTKYDLTPEGFQILYDKCGGKCGICSVFLSNVYTHSEGARTAVDHCHDTGLVRGLLCGNCNSGIGFLRDDINLLTKAMEYLNGHTDR